MAEATVEKGLPKRVKLWNRTRGTDGTPQDYDYKVSGERVFIKYGEYIEVPRRKAVEIRGQFVGKDVPVTLEIEPILDEFEKPQPAQDVNPTGKLYCCPNCDFETPAKDLLKEHMTKHKRGRKKGKASGKSNTSTGAN